MSGNGKEKVGEGREEGKRVGEERGSRREGRGGLSGNVAEEALCLKSAPENKVSVIPRNKKIY